VRRGSTVSFWDYDAAGAIWHTFTRCALPCTGQTGVNYPIANGGNGSSRDANDFESMEVGYGLLIDPSKAQLGGNDPYNAKWVNKGLQWKFKPTHDGLYTFYCRVHPGMRGAFEVVS
jgi:plastocyanin